MNLSEIAQKLGVANRRVLRNPIRLTRFARPRGGIVRAHMTEKQAEAVLTPDGLERWRNGLVLTSNDMNDQTVMAAVMGEQGLINRPELKNPFGGSHNVNAAICGTVALGALIAYNRMRQ